MKIRGKKINVSQRKALTDYGITNPDDYLYTKTEVVNMNGGKRLNHDCAKLERYVFIHRETGEIIRCDSGRI